MVNEPSVFEPLRLYCIYIPVYPLYSNVLFDNTGIAKYLNTMFLLRYIFASLLTIYDLFIARNDSWMSKKDSTRTEQIYVLTCMEAVSEGWDPVKLA